MTAINKLLAFSSNVIWQRFWLELYALNSGYTDANLGCVNRIFISDIEDHPKLTVEYGRHDVIIIHAPAWARYRGSSFNEKRHTKLGATFLLFSQRNFDQVFPFISHCVQYLTENMRNLHKYHIEIKNNSVSLSCLNIVFEYISFQRSKYCLK